MSSYVTYTPDVPQLLRAYVRDSASGPRNATDSSRSPLLPLREPLTRVTSELLSQCSVPKKLRPATRNGVKRCLNVSSTIRRTTFIFNVILGNAKSRHHLRATSTDATSVFLEARRASPRRICGNFRGNQHSKLTFAHERCSYTIAVLGSMWPMGLVFSANLCPKHSLRAVHA